MKIYCVKEKKLTDYVPGSEHYIRTKNNRLMLKCACANCGITKCTFVKETHGDGIGDVLLSAGIKSLYELGKVGTKTLLKSDMTKRAAAKYIKNMSGRMIDQGVSRTLDNLASNIHTMDGRGPHKVGSGWLGSNSMLLPKSKRKTDSDHLREICEQQSARGARGASGTGFDIHKAIGKLPKPKGGFTLPGYKYAGPYNPLEKQLRYDPNTGQILEIYQKPSGKTDAVAMQHDVDYSLCKDDKNCKHKADKKMLRSLDAIPWKERQWGHAAVRNTIAAKQKLGLGINPKKRKQASGTNYFEELADELHKPIIRKFTRRRVIAFHVDQIWAVDLVEMQKFKAWNKGIRYLLMIIDVFSKFGFIEPLKDKKGETVAKAFEKVFKIRKPEKVWSDKGTEFYNKHVNDLFKRKNIELYSTENEEKSSVVERWNRTIKS